jgi:histidine ammonia-lyase
MTLLVETRDDFTLDAYRRAAWQGEAVRIADAAVARMRESRARFRAMLDAEPQMVIYGVTTGYGQMASKLLDAEARRAQAARPPLAAAASFGEPLPERVTRGMVFARLVNYVEGHAAISPELALGVADMLRGDPLPKVPAFGASSAGEILGLSHLFLPLAQRFDLKEKDSLCLVNGAPCAAAMIADAALAAASRLNLATAVFALSAEAIKAPLDAYDEALDDLWGDEIEAGVLSAMRVLLEGGSEERRPYQAPVSFRTLPRILGQAARAAQQAHEVVATSLLAITDNPVFIPPDDDHPNGRVLSNGGYHNAAAAPALDNLAAAWADLALVCDRQINRLLDGHISLLPEYLMSEQGGYIGCLGFVSTDFVEQARHAAQRTFLPGSEGGGFGQNDLAVPTFAAWRKEGEAGRCLDANLAILAATASQALCVTGRQATPGLEAILSEVRRVFPPIEVPRAPGQDAGALAEYFTERVYAAEG